MGIIAAGAIIGLLTGLWISWMFQLGEYERELGHNKKLQELANHRWATMAQNQYRGCHDKQS